LDYGQDGAGELGDIDVAEQLTALLHARSSVAKMAPPTRQETETMTGDRYRPRVVAVAVGLP
jgi:hypothetical protein